MIRAGSASVPPGGFRALKPQLQISNSGEMDELPTAHTCFNQLCLPRYSSPEVLHARLRTAITEGCEGFAMA